MLTLLFVKKIKLGDFVMVKHLIIFIIIIVVMTCDRTDKSLRHTLGRLWID